MMRILWRCLLAGLVAGSVAGCAMGVGFGLRPEELAALANIKDVNVACLSIHATLYGDAVTIFASVDKGISGSVAVSPDCQVQIDTAPKK